MSPWRLTPFSLLSSFFSFDTREADFMLGKGADFSFFLDHNKLLSTKEQAEHPGLVEGIKV